MLLFDPLATWFLYSFGACLHEAKTFSRSMEISNCEYWIIRSPSTSFLSSASTCYLNCRIIAGERLILMDWMVLSISYFLVVSPEPQVADCFHTNIAAWYYDTPRGENTCRLVTAGQMIVQRLTFQKIIHDGSLLYCSSCQSHSSSSQRRAIGWGSSSLTMLLC